MRPASFQQRQGCCPLRRQGADPCGALRQAADAQDGAGAPDVQIRRLRRDGLFEKGGGISRPAADNQGMPRLLRQAGISCGYGGTGGGNNTLPRGHAHDNAAGGQGKLRAGRAHIRSGRRGDGRHAAQQRPRFQGQHSQWRQCGGVCAQRRGKTSCAGGGKTAGAGLRRCGHIAFTRGPAALRGKLQRTLCGHGKEHRSGYFRRRNAVHKE